MATLTQLRCKQCGAPLDQSSGGGSIRCKYCGEVMSIAVPKQIAPEPQQAPRPQVIYQIEQPKEHLPLRYGNKSRKGAILLTFFLGCFGVQNFYLNRVGIGILCLLLLFWTPIPSLIIALIDFIRLICMSDVSFNEKYNRIP